MGHINMNHRKVLEDNIGPMLKLLLEFVRRGYSMNQILAISKCDYLFLLAIFSLLKCDNENIHSREGNIPDYSRRKYFLYLNTLEPLITPFLQNSESGFCNDNSTNKDQNEDDLPAQEHIVNKDIKESDIEPKSQKRGLEVDNDDDDGDDDSNKNHRNGGNYNKDTATEDLSKPQRKKQHVNEEKEKELQVIKAPIEYSPNGKNSGNGKEVSNEANEQEPAPLDNKLPTNDVDIKDNEVMEKDKKEDDKIEEVEIENDNNDDNNEQPDVHSESDDMNSDADLNEEQYFANEYGRDIPIELIISDLKCFRRDVLEYLEVLAELSEMPFRVELDYCVDKLNYVEDLLDLLEQPKNIKEKRLIYNDLKRNRFELRSKQDLVRIEDTEKAIQLRHDTKWLHELRIDITLSPDEITNTVDKLTELSRQRAFQGELPKIEEYLGYLRMIDTVRRRTRDKENTEDEVLILKATLAEQQRDSFELKAKKMVTLNQKLCVWFDKQEAHVQELMAQKARLDNFLEEINKAHD